MPRCIFCDEWAGPDSDQHEACKLEFLKQMRRPPLLRRAFTCLQDAVQALLTTVFGSVARPR